MQVEHVMAFPTETEPPGLEIRVNFGVFAGRAATSAELDDLAQRLLPVVGEVSVIAEERHEVSAATEAVLHQVRIEIPTGQVPDDELRDKLVTLAEIWARACVADRSADLSEL